MHDACAAARPPARAPLNFRVPCHAGLPGSSALSGNDSCVTRLCGGGGGCEHIGALRPCAGSYQCWGYAYDANNATLPPTILLSQACRGCSAPPRGGCREANTCAELALLAPCGTAAEGDGKCASAYCAEPAAGGTAKCYQPPGLACRGARGQRRGQRMQACVAAALPTTPLP